MKELLLIYKDGSHEILKLKDILAIRFRDNFVSIDETKTCVYCIHDIEEIKFL